MKSILQILISENSLQMIFLSEAQGSGENQDSCVAKKQLFAYLNDTVGISNEEQEQESIDYDTISFINPLYHGLNQNASLANAMGSRNG